MAPSPEAAEPTTPGTQTAQDRPHRPFLGDMAVPRPPRPRPGGPARVAVVYYLSRNGQLKHPHFMEVALASPEGLYLRDVIDRLDALRGQGDGAHVLLGVQEFSSGLLILADFDYLESAASRDSSINLLLNFTRAGKRRKVRGVLDLVGDCEHQLQGVFLGKYMDILCKKRWRCRNRKKLKALVLDTGCNSFYYFRASHCNS